MMTLFKCKCGAFFTAKLEITERNRDYTCQNCRHSYRYVAGEEAYIVQENLEKSGFQLMTIPEGASVNVTYST